MRQGPSIAERREKQGEHYLRSWWRPPVSPLTDPGRRPIRDRVRLRGPDMHRPEPFVDDGFSLAATLFDASSGQVQARSPNAARPSAALPHSSCDAPCSQRSESAIPGRASPIRTRRDNRAADRPGSGTGHDRLRTFETEGWRRHKTRARTNGRRGSLRSNSHEAPRGLLAACAGLGLPAAQVPPADTRPGAGAQNGPPRSLCSGRQLP